MSDLIHLSEEMSNELIEEILDQECGDVCVLCGHRITYREELMFPDSPKCCEKHGFVPLCPNHQRWFYLNGPRIGEVCVKDFYLKKK